MTPRQRLKAAMQRKHPDRVPAWCPLSLEHIIKHAIPTGEIPDTIEAFVEAECRLSLRYGFDGVLLFFPGTQRGERIGELLNDLIHTTPAGDASHRFDEADPEKWESDIPTYEVEDFYSSRFAREIIGPDYHLGGWTPDGFSRAIQWFPRLDDAMMATRDDPQRFQALVEHFDRISIAWAKAQVKWGGIESLHISSPYAGSSFISRETYRKLVLPSVKALCQALQDEPVFTYLHTCGFLSDRLETIAESGIHGLECMDPPPLGNVDLADAKQRVGNRLFLKGNIDSVNILLRGSEEDVDQAIQTCLKAGSPGGGYILSTACSVAPAVPPERVEKLARAARQYRKSTIIGSMN